MATTTYEDHGIHFEYPEDWELDVTEEGAITTVSVQSPQGLAFALVTLDETRPEPALVADEALSAMREEYATLESSPALETINDHRAVGHDIEFISLDMTNGCTIRCFRTPRRTVFLFGQWSDLEAEESEPLLRGIRQSLEETDATVSP